MPGQLNLLIDGPKRAKTTMILAHGAGAAMDTEFMTTIAEGLAREKLRVVRFEFSYMAQRRISGKKRPPDRAPLLRQMWQDVIEQVKAKRLIIGGKSMGGRIASLIADESNVAGLVCLGYPFHPTGKPEKLRTEHLESINTPTLIVQGERDAFGNRIEVRGYKLSRSICIHWLPDGDHSFKPRKAAGVSLKDNLAEAIKAVTRFAAELE